MKLLDPIKRLKHLFKPTKDGAKKNQNASKRNRFIMMAFLGLVLTILIVIALFAQHARKKQAPAQAKQKSIEWSSAFGSSFTEKDNQSALQHQQLTIDQLIKQNKDLSHQLKSQQTALADTKASTSEMMSKQIDQLRREIVALQKNQTQTTTKAPSQPVNGSASNNTPTNGYGRNQNMNAFGSAQGQVANYGAGGDDEAFMTFHISEKSVSDGMDDQVKTAKNYVPTGSFCRAVVLGGALANAGVNGQSNTKPINLQLLNDCYLPNGKKSHLKGSFVTASVYGDISSQRGEVKLDRLSYIDKKGRILDIGVEGTAFDIGGMSGIYGSAILKNGKILEMAGTSGLFSGLGDAAKAYAQTNSVSPLGTTTSIDPSHVPIYAAGSGLNTAFAKLSDYYIKLAELYHPVVEVRPGAVVDIVFLKGFSLNPDQKVGDYSDEKKAAPSATDKAKGMLSGIPEMPVNIQSLATGGLINGK